jgi:FKBP-type peptidyl-prolyl cis-trans isomerase
MRFFLFIMVLAALTTACDSKNKKQKHEKGFTYISHERSEYGLSPRVSDVVILNLKITAPNDSILEQANNVVMQIQQPAHKGGSIEDALMFMHRGDSMTFFINALDFYTHSRMSPAPQHFATDGVLRFDIKMTDVMSMKKFEEMRRVKLSSGFLEEREFLENYLDKISKNRTELDSMLFYVPERNGIGPKIKMGDLVTMHYLAYFLDGKLFGNTYKNQSPFVITVGDNSLIEGLSKALIGLQEKSKGRVIIPSYMAYGEAGVKDMIPPFSSLIFDIEILSILPKK